MGTVGMYSPYTEVYNLQSTTHKRCTGGHHVPAQRLQLRKGFPLLEHSGSFRYAHEVSVLDMRNESHQEGSCRGEEEDDRRGSSRRGCLIHMKRKRRFWGNDVIPIFRLPGKIVVDLCPGTLATVKECRLVSTHRCCFGCEVGKQFFK